MPESDLKPMDLRMLRTSGVREEFNAPELERLLGGEGVDLSMTDQAEALRVRLEAGLEVLDRRILASIKLALGRQAKLCGLAGVVLGIIAGAWVAVQVDAVPPVNWALALSVATGGAVLFGLLLIYLLALLVRVRGDLKLLVGLRGRYRGRFEGCSGIPELQDAAREIYDEVRIVGGELK